MARCAADLTGRQAKIVDANGRTTGGRIVRIEASGLTLEHKGAERMFAPASIARIEIRKRQRRRGRVMGTAVGAGIGLAAVIPAVALKRNENGRNSDTLVGAAVGLMAALAVLGFIVGYAADSDTTVITIVP